jgi:hypothetical protein
MKITLAAMRFPKAFPSCFVSLIFLMSTGCTRSASVVFSHVPPASSGGVDSSGLIQGRVLGEHRGFHILLYSFADTRWWVQPFVTGSRTEIAADGSWKAKIHLGTKYAAVLTKDDSKPLPFLDALPIVGRNVRALIVVEGIKGNGLLPEESSEPTLHFSGLEWRVRTIPGSYASKTNDYTATNAFVDKAGALHLRISHGAHGWICSEIHTIRSLGYGNYRMAVEDTNRLEPAAMLSAYNYFEQTPDGDHKELAIHFTRRGVASNTNGEFTIQPSFVPVNFHHFNVPSGTLDVHLDWHPDEAALSISPGAATAGQPFVSWVFKTGVPRSDDTHLFLNFCNFGYAPSPLAHDAEVIVNRFEFYP